MVKIQFANPRLSLLLSLFYPLRVRNSTQPTGLRFAPALSAQSAPASRFTLAYPLLKGSHLSRLKVDENTVKS